MTNQVINIGAAPNDGTGDPLRTAFDKVNDNFGELYLASTSAATGLYPVGTKVACLGDSMFQRGVISQGATFTQILNTASSPMHQAMGFFPAFRHQNYWDASATIANMVPTYAAAMSGDQYFRGANFGVGGDLSIGIQRRTTQVISSGAKICFVCIGTNTDNPDSPATKIPAIETAIAALIAGGVGVVLVTILPRWLGDMLTVVNGLSTTSGTKIISVASTAHGISSSADDIYVLDPVNVNGLSMGGGGYLGGSVTVVDANNFTINVGGLTNASATQSGIGGTVRILIDRFTFDDGTKQTSFCPTPARLGTLSRPIIHSDTNQWIKQQKGRAGVLDVIELNDVLCDPVRQAATGFELAAYHDVMAEGVHINPKGALAYGRKIAAVMQRLIYSPTKQPWFDVNPAGTGNLLTDGNFAGSVANNPTRGGGNKPTNWTIAWSGTAPPAGFLRFEVEDNPDTTGKYLDLYIDCDGTAAANTEASVLVSAVGIADGSVAVGAWLFAAWEIEWLYDPASICIGISPQLQMGSTTGFSLAMHPHTSSQLLQPLAKVYGERFWVIHEPAQKPSSGTLNYQFRVLTRMDRQGIAALRLRRAILRTTTDPALDFPWVP